MTRFKKIRTLLVALCIATIPKVHAVPQASWWNRHVDSISCTRPGYFVNQADCRSFYRCVDRSTWDKPSLQRYDFTCPSGMVFDPAVSVCTAPGANGCADPWWPGSGETSKAGPRNGGGSSLERLPSLFSGGQGNGRPSGSKDPLDSDFGSPSLESSTKPGAEISFGGPLNGGGDPLDVDFGSSLENSGAPRASDGRAPPSLFGGNPGSSKDPLDADFGSPPATDGRGPPSLFGGTTPGRGGPFGSNNNGANSKDPLDADFGSPSSANGPGSRNPLEDGNSLGGGDPLDSEFGSPPQSPSSGENSGSRENPGSSHTKNPSSSETAWGTNSNEQQAPISLELDNWNSRNSNKPSTGAWGGASRPSTDNSWTPNVPWAPGSSSKPSIPESPTPSSPSPPSSSPGRPLRPSWWDPPFARPYRPPGAAEVMGHRPSPPHYYPLSTPRPPLYLPHPSISPPHSFSSPRPPPISDPWLYPYRPRRPTYEIVAYPTWPPAGRRPRPILIVYSNSKK